MKLSDRAWLTRFLVGSPSARFAWWIRRILFVGWIGLLGLDGPGFVRRFSEIQTQLPPGAGRNAAMRRLATAAAGELLVFPVLMIGMLGYGITLDRTAVAAGGRWFNPSWRVSAKAKQRKPSSRRGA